LTTSTSASNAFSMHRAVSLIIRTLLDAAVEPALMKPGLCATYQGPEGSEVMRWLSTTGLAFC
jgi:hypothetical protein